MFGGNSNWRGPIWFPINILLLNALQRYHAVYGDALKVECPTGSRNRLTLLQVEQELAKRLADLFKRDGSGRRPCMAKNVATSMNPTGGISSSLVSTFAETRDAGSELVTDRLDGPCWLRPLTE